MLVGLGFAALATGHWYIAAAVVMMILLTVGDILYKSPSTAYVADSAPDHLQGRFQSMYAGASISGVVLAAPSAACSTSTRRARCGRCAPSSASSPGRPCSVPSG